MFEQELQKVEELLYRDCLEAIEVFAKSGEHNRDVYAFTVEFHPLYAGAFSVGVNTLSGWEKVKERYVQKGSYSRERAEDTGLNSLRWSKCDWTYWCYHDLSYELGQAATRIEQYLFDHGDEDDPEYQEVVNRYAQSVAKVMIKLLPHFDGFHKTEDFIAYTGWSDMSNEQIIDWMRITVPEERLRQLFPEEEALNR